MIPIYRIHPGIGIARLGNSPDAFCISPEEPAALPIDCDAQGNPLLSPDGTPVRVETFKDAEGRIKRQAARFAVWVYDDASPEGRPLRIGDPIEGGGNRGTLVDIQWRVYLANKKASWYEFEQLSGEHGYAPDHPRRNAGVTGDEARQRLIIDPGPRNVDLHDRRRATFGRDGGGVYAATFPPPLQPASIDTLGEILTDDAGRLLVLGGHGSSGSWQGDQFGQPRIDTYANNDGWFDDTADGSVMARLTMDSSQVGRPRFIDVESPAWVVVGYPAYVPQILDMVTMDDVVADVAVTQFAARPDLYGTAGTWNAPQRIDPEDQAALTFWRAGRLQWNPDHRPWFYRDIWTILYRADQFSYLSNVLGQSNFPHNQSARGNFDPEKLGQPPVVDRQALLVGERRCLRRHHRGELFLDTLAPALEMLGREARGADAPRATRLLAALAPPAAPASASLSSSSDNLPIGSLAIALRTAVAAFAERVIGVDPGDDGAAYLARWRAADRDPDYADAERELDRAVRVALAPQLGGLSPALAVSLTKAISDHLRKFRSGQLLAHCRRQAVVAATDDPNRPLRQFLYDILRQAGEENRFREGNRPDSRVYGLPLMPLLAGDNPISNTLPSKFFRLTDLQLYLLRQWARGLFYNETLEGWGDPDPWQPYADWVNRTGRDLDRGVLSNLLGGAFCPGGEIGWIMRNPAIYRAPYRLTAAPAFSQFRQTAAQQNASGGLGNPTESDYAAYTGDDLSQDDAFASGLEPGDLTKSMALPWQADFNECTLQDIDVTYEAFNQIYPESDGDEAAKRQQSVFETLWWPAHRPLQTWEMRLAPDGKPTYQWLDWSRGIPGTNAGDLAMVTAWWRLGFVRKNPFFDQQTFDPANVPSDYQYVAVERGPAGANTQAAPVDAAFTQAISAAKETNE
jgi:hypothetical protein